MFRIYLNNSAPGAQQMIETLRNLCEERLGADHVIEVVDVAMEPRAVLRERLLALPAIVRCSPAPVRRIVGDLSDRGRLALGLELPARAA